MKIKTPNCQLTMASFQTGFIRAPISVMLYVLACVTVTQETTTFANLSDPCYNYAVLDQPWRDISNIPFSVYKCDVSVAWSGWYRLFVNGLSAHIPDTCVEYGHCGTYASLWIPHGHPTVEDGVVTREACSQWGDFCCYIRSFPIKVKACPDNYYVYELVSPTVCNAAYCADVSSINTSSTAITPATISTVYPSVDSCNNYTVLDEPWRANSSHQSNSYKCDRCITWSGWYRLFINGVSTQIPDMCVEIYSCGAQMPLWIRGGHPTVEDGVVTRDVCSHWNNYCCYYGSYPIKVKACPGNYYVYELVRPTIYPAAYCAVAPETSSAGINITLQEGCTSQTGGCLQNILEQIENFTAQVLPLDTVENILNMVFNASEKIVESSAAANSTELASYGNRMLKANEKLISTLVKPTDTSGNVSFILAAVEGQVIMVGPQFTLEKIPRLDTSNSSVDIDLIGIARNNIERSAAVAFMSYNTMENLLKPDFFNTSNNMTKTMMSTVISATLPKTTNTKLTKPVNFTFRHIRELDPNGSLSCVYWNISEWIVDGCSVLKTNSSYTVCSCVHLSTFALIMQTSRPPESDSLLELLNSVCVIVGLVFFSLALMTFALCQWRPGVNNVARINICISLLLAHLLFLLTQRFLSLIRPQQVLCAVISGLLHFLFLSGFVWMFIEAVLLFICVKNLSQISSKKREVLSSGFLCVIGYVVALVVVCVSVGLVPEGYGSEHCWIKMDKGFIWSFLGPVCVILVLNTILFIKIFSRLSSTLTNLNAEVSMMKQAKIMVFKTLAQFVVLGCSWILGFFTNGSKVLEILFLILNSQQGTFIFLIYCVLNNEVRQQYRKFFRCLCCVKQH
ncbi:adhesion G protein-coupled receptor E1-like [Onychostoma macrolepis]|uniref:adhesion G protein-coupled receptor E1-like n=1 Tax=Onychostoma macrolepis TaxID=369639 RepID=UPI00272DB2F1|nr:adhesion G protein-coupled receptor E1-like [Onychostoma macrolepis]